MKKYCFDTSGLSHPLETIPEDIHVNIWKQVRAFIETGHIGVTVEIYAELEKIRGDLGDCIRSNRPLLILEIGDNNWDWESYVRQSTALVASYEAFISEYNGRSKGTVGMNDISIIALAKALSVPVVSMERSVMSPGNESKTCRRIPDICNAENVDHLSFNDFLRRERIAG